MFSLVPLLKRQFNTLCSTGLAIIWAVFILFITNFFSLAVNAIQEFTLFTALFTLLISLVVVFTYYRFLKQDSNSYYIIWMSLFTILFFVVRIPHYFDHMTGEDGIFANIFLFQPQSPNYSLLGRWNGEDLYFPIFHPALEYEVLGAYGKTCSYLFNFNTLSDIEFVTKIRFCFSLLQYIIFALGFLLLLNKVRNSESKNSSIGWFLLMASCPLSVGTSTFLQIDTSFGVFSAGLICLCLLVHSMGLLNQYIIMICFSLASFILGFGKSAWNIVFLLALIISFIYTTIFYKGARNIFLALLSCGIVFLLFGNLVNYYFDPFNYTAGLDLTFDMARNNSFLSKLGLTIDINDQYLAIPTSTEEQSVITFENWWRVFKDRSLVLISAYFMLILIGIYVWQKKFSITPAYFLLIIIGFGLFACYMSGTWDTGGRYFSGANVVLVIISSFILHEISPIKNSVKYVFVGLLLFYIIRDFSLKINLYHYDSKEHMLSSNRAWNLYQEGTKQNCHYFHETYFFNKPSINYITDFTTNEIKDSLVKKYNITICK